MVVDGARPVLAAGSDGVDLLADDGARVARYDELSSWDALGRKLPSVMSVEDGQIVLSVDLRGASFPVIIDPLLWSPDAPIAGPVNPGALLGLGLALVGDAALVGAPGQTVNGATKAGSAYVLERSQGGWAQTQAFQLPDATEKDLFGFRVAFNGEVAAIAAPYRKLPSGLSGAVFVTSRQGSQWSSLVELTLPDSVGPLQFNESMALGSDTLAVSLKDPGALGNMNGYGGIFELHDGIWAFKQLLTTENGPGTLEFCSGLALSGDVLVCSDYDHVNPNGLGAVFVFVRKPDGWALTSTLLPPLMPEKIAGFGAEVALSGDTLLVTSGYGTTGHVHVFRSEGGTWSFKQTLGPPAEDAPGDFGASLAIEGDRALVGAPSTSLKGEIAGAAYAFVRAGDEWKLDQRLYPPGPKQAFGASVALSGKTALVGASRVDVGGVVDAGAVYAFTLRSANGDACASESECASGFCVDGVCCDTACGGGQARRLCRLLEGGRCEGRRGLRAVRQRPGVQARRRPVRRGRGLLGHRRSLPEQCLRRRSRL